MKTPLDNDLNEAYEAFNHDHDRLRQTMMASLPSRSKAHKQTSKIAHIRAFIGDTIMKNRITKLAAAAVIIIAVVIGVNQFEGSIDMTTIAFADISEAMKNVPWMHTVTRGFERGTEVTAETWFSFEPKIFIGKTPDGPVVFTDYKNHSDYRYDPASNTITISYLSDDKPAIDLSSPWSAMEKMVEVFTEQEAEITHKRGKYRGKTVQIQEISLAQNGGNFKLQLFADPKSDLLLASAVKGVDVNGNVVMDGETEFHYPEHGPKDIYDLGVPRSAKINNLLLTPDIKLE